MIPAAPALDRSEQSLRHLLQAVTVRGGELVAQPVNGFEHLARCRMQALVEKKLGRTQETVGVVLLTQEDEGDLSHWSRPSINPGDSMSLAGASPVGRGAAETVRRLSARSVIQA